MTVKKYIPVTTGLLLPIATFLNVQALTVPGWLVNDGNDTEELLLESMGGDNVYARPTVVLAFQCLSLSFGLLGTVSLFVRMLEKKIKWTTRLMILGAFGQGLVSFCLVVIFTLTTAMTRTNKSTYKYTEGLAYALVCGIASLSVAILATYQQHLNRTQVYIHIMYELSPSQRQLILLTIASLTYLILLGSIYALLEKWDFNDALYWCLVTLTTIGFGDITPQTTVGKALLPLVSSAGILLIGFQIYAIRQVALELITLQLASQFSKSFGIDQELVGLSSATSDPSRSGNGAWSSLENGVHGSGYDSLGRRGRGRVRKRAYSLTDGFGYGALVHSPRLSSPSPSPALSPMPYLSDHYGRDQGPSDFDALDLAAPAITTPKMTPHDPTYQGDQQNVPQHLRSPEQHHHQHQRQHHQHHQSHDVHLGSTHPAPRRTKTTSHLLQNVDTGTNGGGHHFRRTYTAPLAETPSTPPFSPQAPRTMTISRSAALPQLTIVAGADVRRSQVVEVAIATFKQQITYGVVAVAANFVFFGGLFAYFEKWNFFEGVYFSYIALTTIGYGDYTLSTVQARSLFIWHVFIGIGSLTYLGSMIAERAFNQWVLVCDKIERRVDRYERKARFKKMYRRSNGGRGGGGSNGQSSSVKWGGVNIGTESGARDSDGGVGRTKRDSKKRWGAEEAEEDVRKGSASATAAVAATEAGRQDDAQKVVDAWRGQSQQNGQLDGTAIGTVRDGQSAVLSQVFAEPEEENEHGSLSTTTLPLTPQNIFESGLAGGSHPATPSSLLSSAVQLNGTGRTNPSLPTTSETPGEMVPPSLPTILSSGPTASTSTMPSILTHNYNSSRPPHPPPSSSSSYAHHQIRLDYSNTTNPHALSSTRRPYSAENRLSSGRPNHNRGLSVGSVPLGGFFSSSTGGGLRRNNSTSSSRRGVVRVERPLSSSSSAIGPAGTSFFGRRSPGSVVGRFSRDPLLSSSSSEESEGSESDDGRRRGPAARGGSGRRRSGRGGLSSSDGGGGNSTKEESDSESGGEGRGVRHRRHHGSQYARQRGTRRQMYDSQDADPLAGNVEYVERAHHRRQSVPLLRSSTEHISTGNSSAAGADIGSESAGLSAGTTSGAGLLGRSLGRVVASGWEAMTRGRGGSRSHEQLGAAEVGTRSPARDGEVDETAPLLQPSS